MLERGKLRWVGWIEDRIRCREASLQPTVEFDKHGKPIIQRTHLPIYGNTACLIYLHILENSMYANDCKISIDVSD